MTEADPIRRVCFIGLGKMGWPMAAQVTGAGYKVAPVDVAEGAADRFAKEFGGELFASASEAAAQADAVITILPTSKQVTEVAEAIRPALRPGTIIIEMSSGVPSITQKLAGQMAEIGVTLVDAPVSGGVARAKSGDLAIMVGGDPGTIGIVEPLLKTMGTTIVRVGSTGAGQEIGRAHV